MRIDLTYASASYLCRVMYKGLGRSGSFCIGSAAEVLREAAESLLNGCSQPYFAAHKVRVLVKWLRLLATSDIVQAGLSPSILRCLPFQEVPGKAISSAAAQYACSSPSPPGEELLVQVQGSHNSFREMQ